MLAHLQMNTQDTSSNETTRREFIKSTGKFAAASALAGVALPNVHAAGSDVIQLALVGCGGRGTGAANNALSTSRGPTKLVAMADVFPAKLSSSYGNLSRAKSKQVDVPRDRQFLGFDAYKKAMDCLRPGDVVILTTPCAFRWVHYPYAIEKGLNVFMEKPVTPDGPTSKLMLDINKKAKAKDLKVGVGLNSRHARHLQQLVERVHNGEIGDVILERGYRMHGPAGFFSSTAKPPGISNLMYQIQRFHSFIWASGGNFSDFYIHIIDHLGWMKNEWPVKAQALGGRHYKKSPEGVEYVDQNFDTYSVEYTYADGTKFFFDGRCMNGCKNQFSSYIHGTKGSAIVSNNGDCGAPSRIFKGQSPNRSDMVWQSRTPRGEENWYVNEWNDLMDAIRGGHPYNEVDRGVTVSVVTSMGRMAAHTGQEITFDQMLNCPHRMAPGLDKLKDENSPAPLQPDANGRYPVPMPGQKKDREY